jgi:hypothetical protein
MLEDSFIACNLNVQAIDAGQDAVLPLLSSWRIHA